jgi:protein-disulfide isomerase
MEGKSIMIGILAMLAGAGGAVAVVNSQSDPVNVSDRAAVEKVVREYILSHPEILPEAMQNLQARELKKVVDANRKLIETPFAGAWEGAADGDVTLVQFFDYACGYCRASRPDLERLLAEDKKLRVVYRELPILGPDSEAAARASLAVAQQGHYAVFHDAIYAGGRPSAQAIAGAVAKAGADTGKVKAAARSGEVENEIAHNMELQRALQLTGTPGWVIGDQVLNGAVGYDELKKAIAAARAGKS